MKKTNSFLCAAVMAVLLGGCGAKNQFTINGTVGDFVPDGTKIFMFDLTNEQEAPVDSTVVADGKYTFKGIVEEPYMAMVGSPDGFVLVSVVEPGDIVMTMDSVGGTTLNDRLQAFNMSMMHNDIMGEMESCMAALGENSDEADRAEAMRKLDSLQALGDKFMQEATWKLYHENGDNVLGLNALQNILRSTPMSYHEMDSIVKAASPYVAGHKSIQALLGRLRALDQTSVGRHYTDIQGLDGKLSDIIDGKVALVDFYASWCGPCREAIANHLMPLWQKYEDKGLVVVGVNVMEQGDAAARKAAFEKVTADLGITYPQLVDTTRASVDAYGIQGIPQVILIGRDGTILGRDLFGDAIDAAVADALK